MYKILPIYLFTTMRSYIKFIILAGARIVISMTIIGAALYIVLSRAFPDDYVKWAFGIIGVITGYWLNNHS